MLMNQYEYSLDAKNRLFIPARLRQSHKKFIITYGPEICLLVYGPEQWNKLTSGFNDFDYFSKKNSRMFLRLFMSGAVELELDNQGRVLLPKNHCEYAGLKKDIVIVGVLDRMEIWDKKNWKGFTDIATKKFPDVMENLPNVRDEGNKR